MNAMMDRQYRLRLPDARRPSAEHSNVRASISSTVCRPFCWTTTLGLAVVTYMIFEAQWIRCREVELSVPGLPPEWSGLRVLHLSDVHAGLFLTNERSLEKAVRWATPRAPDLVLLTGDVLGDPRRSGPCLELLTRLGPPLGTFAVTGNHEYGIGKDPLARPRDTSQLWEKAGITLLIDRCVPLPARKGSRVILCGADYLTGGHGLAEANGPATESDADFPILLIHEPPPAGSPLAKLFPLAFAGHTHGGQLRLPGRDGLEPIHREGGQYLEGVQAWGDGRLVVSHGVGTSFLPFRMLTRPEASLWRLV